MGCKWASIGALRVRMRTDSEFHDWEPFPNIAWRAQLFPWWVNPVQSREDLELSREATNSFVLGSKLHIFGVGLTLFGLLWQTTTDYSLLFWKLGKSTIKALTDMASAENLLPRSWKADFWLGPYMAEGAREPSGASFITTPIPFGRAPLSGSHHLPKTPSPHIPSCWGLGGQCKNWGVGEYKHSVHSTTLKFCKV